VIGTRGVADVTTAVINDDAGLRPTPSRGPGRRPAQTVESRRHARFAIGSEPELGRARRPQLIGPTRERSSARAGRRRWLRQRRSYPTYWCGSLRAGEGAHDDSARRARPTKMSPRRRERWAWGWAGRRAPKTLIMEISVDAEHDPADVADLRAGAVAGQKVRRPASRSAGGASSNSHPTFPTRPAACLSGGKPAGRWCRKAMRASARRRLILAEPTAGVRHRPQGPDLQHLRPRGGAGR